MRDGWCGTALGRARHAVHGACAQVGGGYIRKEGHQHDATEHQAGEADIGESRGVNQAHASGSMGLPQARAAKNCRATAVRRHAVRAGTSPQQGMPGTGACVSSTALLCQHMPAAGSSCSAGVPAQERAQQHDADDDRDQDGDNLPRHTAPSVGSHRSKHTTHVWYCMRSRQHGRASVAALDLVTASRGGGRRGNGDCNTAAHGATYIAGISSRQGRKAGKGHEEDKNLLKGVHDDGWRAISSTQACKTVSGGTHHKRAAGERS